MIGIYKITNPKGKVYIGQAINLKIRWGSYNRFDSSKTSIGPKLYNSFQKSKPENHKFEILCECEINELDQLETLYKKFYLNKLGNWDKVLFCGLHDSGGGPKTQETKDKMSISQQFHLLKPYVLEKRLINCKKSSTLEVKLKRIKNTNWDLRNKNLLNKKKGYGKFEKYTINDELIKEYNNINDILIEFNNPRPQNLYSCLKGKYKTWMGFKWKGYYK